MAYDVGSPVILDINLVDKGNEVPTKDVPSTVLSRSYLYDSQDPAISGTPIYSYQLIYPTLLYYGPQDENGNYTISGQLFTTDDLTMSGLQATGSALDLSNTYANLDTSKAVTTSATNTISDALTKVNNSSPYYDLINNLQGIVTAGSDVLNATTIDEAKASNISGSFVNFVPGVKEADRNSALLGTNATLSADLAANLQGFYDVLTAQEQAIKDQSDMVFEQDMKAAQDDNLNFQTVQTVFLEAPETTNLLIPQDGTTKTILDPEDPANSGIPPESLITDAVILED